MYREILDNGRACRFDTVDTDIEYYKRNVFVENQSKKQQIK